VGGAIRNGFRRCLPSLLLLAGFVFLWAVFPSQNLNYDGLDELLQLEAGEVPTRARHPLAEPALNLWVGERASAIRPVQIWSGLWMTLALAGLMVFGIRSGASATATASAVALGTSSYAILHLATDPFLAYLPPGLALTTWGLAFGLVSPQRRIPAVALLSLAALFCPFSLAGAGAAAGESLRRKQVRAALIHVFVPGLLLFGAMNLADLPVGRWSPANLGPIQLVREGPVGALVPVERGFAPLRVLTEPLSPAAWATLAALGAAVGWLAGLLWKPEGRQWPLLGSAGGSALFVGLWDPAAEIFWVVPGGLLLLAWLQRPVRPALTAALAALLLSSNVVCYVLPASQQPDPRVASARALGAHFSAKDFLITKNIPDVHIAYFGGLRIDGPVERIDELSDNIVGTQRAGGGVFVEGPELPEGYPWGETTVIGSRSFTELLGLP